MKAFRVLEISPSFLISALVGPERLASRCFRFTPEEGDFCLGGWVGPRVGVHALQKEIETEFQRWPVEVLVEYYKNILFQGHSPCVLHEDLRAP